MEVIVTYKTWLRTFEFYLRVSFTLLALFFAEIRSIQKQLTNK